MLISPLYRFFALLLLPDRNSIFSKINTSARRRLFLGHGHGWSRPVVLAFMLCTHAYSCARARVLAYTYACMRLSHRPLLPVHRCALRACIARTLRRPISRSQTGKLDGWQAASGQSENPPGRSGRVVGCLIPCRRTNRSVHWTKNIPTFQRQKINQVFFFKQKYKFL